MRPEIFQRIIDDIKSQPEKQERLKRLAQALGELIVRGDRETLAMVRSLMDAGRHDLIRSGMHVLADQFSLLLEVAASASMHLETKQENEELTKYIAKPPYSDILPLLETESMRLSVLVQRCGLHKAVVLEALDCLATAHLVERHGKPDPIVRIMPRGCHALERLRAKNKTPPTA